MRIPAGSGIQSSGSLGKMTPGYLRQVLSDTWSGEGQSLKKKKDNIVLKVNVLGLSLGGKLVMWTKKT